MTPTKITTIPVFPSTHVRSTKNEQWIIRVEDDRLEAMDLKRLETKGKKGGLLRRKHQLEKNIAHKTEIRTWVDFTGFKMPSGAFAVWFYVPMPRSWRKKDIREKCFTPHQNTPDLDNFTKQLYDAIMPRRNRISGELGCDDRKVHCNALFKVWVPYDMGCMKILEYNQEEFIWQFRHGHPAYDPAQDLVHFPSIYPSRQQNQFQLFEP